jgi:hypothetical protein
MSLPDMGAPKCGANGKIRYANRTEARTELARYAHAKGSRRAYYCVFCDGYHLTKGQRGNRKGKP